MTETIPEHSCEVNKITTCDGEWHYTFCMVCSKEMGVDNCEEAGTWPNTKSDVAD